MKQLSVDALDFDTVKENLKNFLRSQNEFNSYDFEGSALTILLDVLAYNTTYNALYTNMALNESFIDSATKRSSLISLAKSLGYTPKSIKSATAILDITVTLPSSDTATTLTLPRGTIFNGVVGENSYQFVTLTDKSVVKNNGAFLFENVEVTQGTILNKTYPVTDDSNYVIPSSNADLSSLVVLVRESSGSSTVIRFNQPTDLFKAKPTDPLFFIKQRDDQLYEIYFGNDAIGRKVINGNLVRIEYIESAGEEANGSNLFVYESGFRSDAAYDIVTIQPGMGGTAEEELESIRFNAPRAFVSQNRAVTASDYETLLLSAYPRIETIHAWGGQDNIPKVYGKVFICAKPYNEFKFTPSEKAAMEKTLSNTKGVVSVTPVLVDPMYMNIELSCNVYYNPNASKWSPGKLESLVKNRLIEYAKTLNKFDSVFRYSKLSAIIDSVDSEGISSNSVSFRIRCPFDPLYNSNGSYKLITGNPITPNSVWSTRFNVSYFTDRAYIKDNGSGILELYSENIDGIATKVLDIGTIDYTAGSWNIPSLYITSLYDPMLEIVFTPKSNDVVSNRNILVSLPNNTIIVTAILDSIASGAESGGEKFIFSDVR